MPDQDAMSSPSDNLEAATGVTTAADAGVGNVSGTLPGQGAAPGSSSNSFSEKRIAFFARHEALFLWLLAPPVIIIGLLLLGLLMLWMSGKGAMLELFFRSGQWRP